MTKVHERDGVAGNVRERASCVARLLGQCATPAVTRVCHACSHSFVPSLVFHLPFIVCMRTYAFSETHDAGSREMGLSSRPARCSPQEADGKEWEGGGEER